ncbi:MAG: PIN domain-containing protein [Acidobacteria bacterium]|nr:MAG: PIN domain-containing protein [Acidobacteriota bacterium]
MILVDTSVWVSVLRSPGSPEAPIMAGLLDADEVGLAVPVRVELLSGVSPRDLAALKRALSALPLLYPTDDTWRLLDAWTEKAAKAGQHFGVGDLLIGALAAEAGALVWSLDGDFARMEKLKLVECYEP